MRDLAKSPEREPFAAKSKQTTDLILVQMAARGKPIIGFECLKSFEESRTETIGGYRVCIAGRDKTDLSLDTLCEREGALEMLFCRSIIPRRSNGWRV